MHPLRLAIAAALLALPASVSAQEALRPICANGPAPCIVDAGHLQAELTGFAERSRGGGLKQDVWGADLLLRYGLDAATEVQLGLSPYGRVRERDLATGTGSTVSGFGDLTFAVRRSLADSDRVSVAVQPFVTVPAGDEDVSANAWGGGVILPISFGLGGDWGLDLIPEVDVVPDSDGTGRHLAYAAEVGLGRGFGDVSLGAALFAMRDEDPAGGVTQATLEVSGAWTPSAAPNLQFDAGVVTGLNDDSPDLSVFAVASRRF